MRIAHSRPFQLLYFSDAAPGTRNDTVIAIAAVSRQRNLACEISGALLFDGRRFCQLLEGSEPDVRVLMARIEVDPRHGGITITAANHFGLPRLMTRWRMGHCHEDVLDPLTSAPLPKDEVALAMFMSALAGSAIV